MDKSGDEKIKAYYAMRENIAFYLNILVGLIGVGVAGVSFWLLITL